MSLCLTTILILTGIILAGGMSRRLGRNKAFVPVGGAPIIERVMDALRRLAAETIICANDPKPYERYGLRIARDIHEDVGALGGLHAGLSAMSTERGIAVACDMPFLNIGLLRFMAEYPGSWDALVPVWSGEYEPLHAMYSKNCIGAIEDVIRLGQRRIFDFYPKVALKTIKQEEIARLDPDGLSFFNINNEADLVKANEIANRKF